HCRIQRLRARPAMANEAGAVHHAHGRGHGARHRRATPWRPAYEGMGQPGDDREPPRRERRHRHAGRGESARRRLHVRLRAGIRFYNVAFNGTIPAMTATINGDTALVVDGITPLLPHVKSGKLKAIAITSPEVLPGLESIPLAKDVVPGLNVMGWFGIAAPK